MLPRTHNPCLLPQHFARTAPPIQKTALLPSPETCPLNRATVQAWLLALSPQLLSQLFSVQEAEEVSLLLLIMAASQGKPIFVALRNQFSQVKRISTAQFQTVFISRPINPYLTLLGNGQDSGEGNLLSLLQVMPLATPRVTLRDYDPETISQTLKCMNSLAQGHLFSARALESRTSVWFSRYSFNSLGAWVSSMFENRILEAYRQFKSKGIVTRCSGFTLREHELKLAQFVQSDCASARRARMLPKTLSRLVDCYNRASYSLLLRYNFVGFELQQFQERAKVARRIESQFHQHCKEQVQKSFKKKNKVQSSFANKKSNAKEQQLNTLVQTKAECCQQEDLTIQTVSNVTLVQQINVLKQVKLKPPQTQVTSAQPKKSKAQRREKKTYQEEGTEAQEKNKEQQQGKQKEKQKEKEKEKEKQKEKEKDKDKEDSTPMQEPVKERLVEETTQQRRCRRKRVKKVQVRLAKEESHSTSDSVKDNFQSSPQSMNNRIKIDKAIELKLARDLLAFTDSLSLDSNRVVDQRISVFERVKDHISRRFDRCQIFLFGSAATGVSLESSDIDVLVFEELEAELSDEARLQLVQERLKEIEEDFQRKDWVRELNYYPKASVPVLKLMVAGGKPNSWLKVDISMETKALHMNFGYQATLLTKNWLDLLPGLSPLLILLKHRLSREGLNRVYSGGLSSYSLFVMIASFLKDYSRTTHGHNYFNMLIELLQFYGTEFIPSQHAVQLRPHFECFFQITVPSPAPVSVLDPLNGRVMTANAFQFHNIQLSFVALRQRLTEHRERLLAASLEHFQDEMERPLRKKEIGRLLDQFGNIFYSDTLLSG